MGKIRLVFDRPNIVMFIHNGNFTPLAPRKSKISDLPLKRWKAL